MYNRLDTVPACDRQTDGRTDRQTGKLYQSRLIKSFGLIFITTVEE